MSKQAGFTRVTITTTIGTYRTGLPSNKRCILLLKLLLQVLLLSPVQLPVLLHLVLLLQLIKMWV